MAEQAESALLPPSEKELQKLQAEADNPSLYNYLRNPEDTNSAGFDIAGASITANEGSISAGYRAGIQQVKGEFNTFGAIVDYLQGDEKAAEVNMLQAQNQEAQANEIRQNYANFNTAFDSPEEFFEYGGFQLGQVTPQLLSFVAGGYASAVTYGLGKVALKTGTKKWVKNKLDDIVAKKAAKIALTADETAILSASHVGLNSVLKKGFVEEGSEEAIQKAAANFAKNKVSTGNVLAGTDKWGSRAFWAGGFAVSNVIGSAASLQEYDEQGFELGKKEAALALAYGIPQATLDTVSNKIFFGGFFKNAMKDAVNAVSKKEKTRALGAAADILKAGGLSAGVNAFVEGGTEAGQEAILIAQRTKDPIGNLLGISPGSDPEYSKEMQKLRLAESALVGGILGTTRGAAGGIISESFSLMNQGRSDADDIQERAKVLQEQGLPLDERKFDIEGQMDSMLNTTDQRDIVYLANLTLQDLQTAQVTDSVLDLKKYSGKYGVSEFAKGSQNPGLVFHNVDNPNSVGLAQELSKSDLSDEVLAKGLGFSGTQAVTDKYVVVAKDEQGRNISTESVPIDRLEAAVAKAKEMYPNATVEPFLKEEFVKSQNFKVKSAVEDEYEGGFGDDEVSSEIDFEANQNSMGGQEPTLGSTVANNRFGDAETRPVDIESVYVATDGNNTVELAQQGQDTFLIDQYSKNTFGSSRSKTLQKQNTGQASAKEGRWGLISDVDPKFQADRTPNDALKNNFLKKAEQVNPELAARLEREMTPKNEIQKSLMETFLRAVEADPASDYNITSTEKDSSGNPVYRIIKNKEDDSRRNLRNIINIASEVANKLERPDVNTDPLARAFRVGVAPDADLDLAAKNSEFLKGQSEFPFKIINIKSLIQNIVEQEGMGYDVSDTARLNYGLTAAIGELAQAGFSLEYKNPKGKGYKALTSMSDAEIRNVRLPQFMSTSKEGRARVSTKTVGGIEPSAKNAASEWRTSYTMTETLYNDYLEAGGQFGNPEVVNFMETQATLLQNLQNKPTKEQIASLGGRAMIKDDIVFMEFVKEYILDAAYRDQINIGNAESRSFGGVEGLAETPTASTVDAKSLTYTSEDQEFKESDIRSEFGKDYIINDLAADLQDKTPYRAISPTYNPAAGKTTISPGANTAFDAHADTKNVLNSVDKFLRETFKNQRAIEVITVGEKYKATGSEKTIVSNKEGETFGKQYSREHLITKVQNQVRRDNETAKFVSFNDRDVIIVNTDNLANNPERASLVFTDTLHEFGHSIIEDNMSTLFKQSYGKTKFIVDTIEKDFLKAQKELQVRGSKKYDGENGREEYIADRIASISLQDVSSNPKSAADVFFKKLYNSLKQFFKKSLAIYNGRYKARDIDSDIRKSLSKFVNTDRPISFRNEYKIRSAVEESFKEHAKTVSVKAARKLKQITLDLWRSDLGTLTGSKTFDYWSLSYLLNTSSGYLTKKSKELGKAMYGLTQSEDDFGYKRTYILEQNQALSKLLDIVPKDKKGNPDLDQFERISSIAESNIPTDQLTDPAAVAFRKFLFDFYETYVKPNQTFRTDVDKIKFLKDFFPRIWEMSYLRESSDARETLAVLLHSINSNPESSIDMGLTETALDSTKVENWRTYVDKWLATDQDNDTTDVDAVGENLSIGMSKARSAYFRGLTTDMIREADAEMLTPASNAIRRYIQDTVKRLEYDKAVQTTYTQQDAERLKTQAKTKEPIVPSDRIGSTVYGWQATEVMLSRIEEGSDRTGARRSVEAMLGKHGQGMSPLMRNINSWGLLINMFAYLSMAALASAPDLAGPTLRSKGKGGVSKNAHTIVDELKYYFKNKEAAASFARTVGVVSYDSILDVYIDAAEMGFMNQKTKKLASWFFKANLLDAYTRFTRTFAAGMGEQFIFSLAVADDDKTNLRHMRELKVTRADLDWYYDTYSNNTNRTDRDYTSPEGKRIKRAIGQFVEESILRPSGAERPTWASNPYFALVFQLKSFFYAYGKNIIGGAGREMQNRYEESGISGAAVPLYIAALTLLPLTAVGLETRELLKFLANGGDSSQFKTDNMDWGSYIFELTDRAGVFGPFAILGSISQSNRYGDSPIGPLLGPSAERFEDYILNKELINNKEDVFWDFIPIASGLDLDYLPN